MERYDFHTGQDVCVISIDVIDGDEWIQNHEVAALPADCEELAIALVEWLNNKSA